MKRHWIEYSDKWKPGPMSFWVHRAVDAKSWREANVYNPALPNPVPGRGFPGFYVEFNGFTFHFASLDELRVCIATLSNKLLPTTYRLIQNRDDDVGPNSHWLSRLPAKVKPWRYREGAVVYLAGALTDFEREITAHSD